MEFLSFYTDQKSTTKKDISILDYIHFVKEGAYQDLVIPARAEYKTNGKTPKYKQYKDQAKCVTGSAVMNPGAKTAANVAKLNGLIVIDVDVEVDEQLKTRLKNDKYTYILHHSFSGEGICIFVKINPNRFVESFNQLAQYYFENYEVTIDEACKNINRLRYISYDPDLFYNEKSEKFNAKAERKPKPKPEPYIFTSGDDIEYIMKQIQERGIDLVKGEYVRYRNIGFSLYSEFGEGTGKRYFDVVNQYNTRLNQKRYNKEWKSFCKPGAISIGTFYKYCKEEGVDLFTPRSKEIINRVKVQRSQGGVDINSVNKTLQALGEQTMNDNEVKFAQKLIESKNDLSKEANKDVSDIEQIERFIIDAYNPKRDVISDIVYIRETERLTESELNDIYIACKKNFDFNVPMSDVRSIINSNSIGKINRVKDFIKDNNDLAPSGVIDKYVDCIHPRNEYNKWAFKKWIVGAIHNWTAPEHEKLVCPLTLVLTGQKHGTGKTSFFRNCMPKELQMYFVEGKINAHDKDSQYLLSSSLIVFDDEFGGKAFKDVKEYKAISDINTITQRRPYASTVSTFKRRAILCGTSNETDVLKDVTGNRRILPINIESIDFDDMIAIDKTDLFMEAYRLYKDGYDWKIYREEDIAYLSENTSKNDVVIPLEEIFFDNFSLEEGGDYKLKQIMNQGEILEWFYQNTSQKPSRHEIKDIFVKNKMSYGVFSVDGKNKKGFKLYSKFIVLEDEAPF